MPLIALMTFVLITSSAMIATAGGAAHRGDLKKATRYVILTAIAGDVECGTYWKIWVVLLTLTVIMLVVKVDPSGESL